MLYFANKHPGVLVFLCLVKFYTANCKLILMANVIAMIVFTDVMLNVVADVMPLI